MQKSDLPFTRLIATTLVSLAIAGVTNAADMKIYGKIDTGLIYNSYFGDSTTNNALSMDSGRNSATRVGIEGSESLGNDMTVIWRLESRFLSDSGQFKTFTKGKAARMFGGQSTIGITTRYGTLSAGRVGGVGSGGGWYDIVQYNSEAFGGGAPGIANGSICTGRYDNTLTYQSPQLAGFQLTAQYSMKGDSFSSNTAEVAQYDALEDNKSSVNRYYSTLLTYKAGDLVALAAYEGQAYANDSRFAGANKNMTLITVGGHYKTNVATLYAQAQYFDGLNTIHKFSARDANALHNLTGYSVSLGAQWWFPASSLKTALYWKDFTKEVNAAQDVDGQSFGASAKYLYDLSKRSTLYIGGGYGQADRIDGSLLKTDKNINIFGGLTHVF